MGSVSVAWHNVLAGHIGQAFLNCAPGNIACILQNCHYHPGQLRGVFSSVELAVCLPVFRLHAPLLAYKRSPPTLLARGFGLAFLNAPLGPSQPRMDRCATSARAPVNHPNSLRLSRTGSWCDLCFRWPNRHLEKNGLPSHP